MSLTRREMMIGSAVALGTLAMAPALSGCATVASSGKRRIRPHYDAIVIGTGFGGAVAACRLAQAGLSVGVLERGRRYDINPFPRNWNNPFDVWLWSSVLNVSEVNHFYTLSLLGALADPTR